MKLNEVLDLLAMEANRLMEEIRAVALLLDACPNCRVKHAGAVKGLQAQAEAVMDVMVALRGLKERDEPLSSQPSAVPPSPEGQPLSSQPAAVPPSPEGKAGEDAGAIYGAPTGTGCDGMEGGRKDE